MLKIPLSTYLIIFLLLIGVFTVFALKYVPDTKLSSVANGPLVIEESMTGVQASRFDNEGHLTQVIRMTSWLYYKNQTTTHFQFPSLTLYQPDGNTWRIHAKQGKGFQKKVHGKPDKFELTDDVVVENLDEINKVKLTSPDLLYYPAKTLAQTDSPVVVHSPSMEIQAKGMRAHLDNQLIEFTHNVRCQYAKLPS